MLQKIIVIQRNFQGRNEYASQIILDKLELVNIDIAFLALKDESLPGELRGKFCAFIKGIKLNQAEKAIQAIQY